MQKTMPEQPANPQVLLGLLDAQTRTLSKLREVQYAAVASNAAPSIADYPVDAVEAASVSNLRPLLATLTPEMAVLQRVVASGSPGAITALFDLHGPEVYRAALEGNQGQSVSLGEPMKRGDWAFLKAIHDAGINLAQYGGKMLMHAVRHEDAAYLSFVRNEIGCGLKILEQCQPDKVLETPWVDIVDDLVSEIRMFATKTEVRPTRFMLGAFQSQPHRRLREIAICLHVVPNLARVLQDHKVRVNSPKLQELIAMTDSNHGKLTLMRLEPDLGDILRRSIHAPFYGISVRDLKA